MKKMRRVWATMIAAAMLLLNVQVYADEPVTPVVGEPAVCEADSIGLEVPMGSVYSLQVSGNYLYNRATSMMTLINNERAAKGLSPLKLDYELTEAAMQRAAEASVDFSHTRPNGTDCFTVCGKMFGENLAAGYPSIEDTFMQWKSSPGHYANIMTPDYTSIGIGCFYNGVTYYWAQAFSYYPGSGTAKTADVAGIATVNVIKGALQLKADYDSWSDTIDLVSGETRSLKPGSINPGFSVVHSYYLPTSFTWSSSNPAVASVTPDGKVTGISAGTAIIRMTTKSSDAVTTSLRVNVDGASGIISPPGEVMNLKAVSAGKNQVRLTWNYDDAYGLADGYLIYAKKNGRYGYCGMTSGAQSYLDTNALDSDYNYYWVFAYVKDIDAKMYTSGCARYVFAKGLTTAVEQLRASSAVGRVNLSWKAVPGAEGYLVYGIRPGQSYGYIGMTTRGTVFSDIHASKDDWTFYWVYPYHKDALGKMLPGGTAHYVYGKAR